MRIYDIVKYQSRIRNLSLPTRAAEEREVEASTSRACTISDLVLFVNIE